jgi:hypothetical protein
MKKCADFFVQAFTAIIVQACVSITHCGECRLTLSQVPYAAHLAT